MTTDERPGKESMKTTVLGEIKAAEKERQSQHAERKLLLWGKGGEKKKKRNLRWEEKKKEEEIKKRKIV